MITAVRQKAVKQFGEHDSRTYQAEAHCLFALLNNHQYLEVIKRGEMFLESIKQETARDELFEVNVKQRIAEAMLELGLERESELKANRRRLRSFSKKHCLAPKPIPSSGVNGH